MMVEDTEDTLDAMKYDDVLLYLSKGRNETEMKKLDTGYYLLEYTMSRNPVVKLDMAVSVSDVRLELSPSTSKMVEKLVDL